MKSMKASKRIIDFIAQHEGFRSRIYKDPYGYPTIGYGHLLREGEEELFKNGITREQALELLQQDIREAEKAVNLFVKVPLTQNQFDALVSFTYNVGSGNLKKSTLLRKLNEGDYMGAADEFLRWVGKQSQKPLPGLQRRRSEERKIFLTP